MDLPRKYPEAMSQPIAPSLSPAKKIRRTEGRVQATDSKFMQAANSSGLCLFGLTLGGLPVREWIQAATGWDISDRELLAIGERILTLRRIFNCREGLRIEDVRLPKRVLGKPGFRKGPLANLALDPAARVKAYCEVLGWDPVTGAPSPEKVKELGLGWAVDT
jgi:aldehyde:ferredoxin oxidoreductase